MRRIRNATRRPVRVPLAGNKVLHLGPAQEGQTGDESLGRPAFRKLVDAGVIEVLDPEGAEKVARSDGSRVRAETHGHHPTTVVKPKGDR